MQKLIDFLNSLYTTRRAFVTGRNRNSFSTRLSPLIVSVIITSVDTILSVIIRSVLLATASSISACPGIASDVENLRRFRPRHGHHHPEQVLLAENNFLTTPTADSMPRYVEYVERFCIYSYTFPHSFGGFFIFLC